MTSRQTRDMVLSNYLRMRATALLLDLDETGKVIDANNHALKLLGADCVGKPFENVIVDFRKSFDLADLRSQLAPELLTYNTINNMPVSLKTHYIPLGSGGIIVGEYDHNETTELQNTLIKLNNELNNISRDLQKQTIQLQHTSDLKDQFMGMAAHDLRNPLATVYTYIDLLSEDIDYPDNQPMMSAFDEIKNEVKYMLDMVSNLLDYSVIELGHLNLQKQTVDIQQMLVQAVQSNSMLSSRRNVSIHLHAVEDLGEIELDMNRIRQTLNNLISNAVKFSPEASRVDIRTEKDDAFLKIIVEDHGPGIPDHMVKLLFLPFGKTGEKSFSGEKSTGLGLAICRRIVEAHNGTIGVESLQGTGSRFWFTIPLPCCV